MNDADNDRALLRRAAQIVALADDLLREGPAHPPRGPSPTLWTALTIEEVREEWESLRAWVDQLRLRFPNVVRIPDCWYLHNDLVEVLVALRDHERVSYDRSAPATGPIEWHRALRDMEARIETWIRRFGCVVAGRGHDRPERREAPPDGWTDHLDADVRQRERHARRRSASYPTPDPSREPTKGRGP